MQLDVLERTRERFPQMASRPLAMEPLEKGGSDRKFFRIRAEGEVSLIFVQYGMQREENRHYVAIGAFLERVGVRVPRMYVHEAETGRIWMEDLGERDLWSFRKEPWPVRERLYQATLRELERLHSCLERRGEACVEGLPLQPPFDEKLYEWEQNYFLEHCLGRHFGVEDSVISRLRESLRGVASDLAALPRVLVHRDCQSQNIVLVGESPCFIDFQGMRLGLPQYDLASLLLDPYVEMAPSERDALLGYYLSLHPERGAGDPSAFRRVYQLCAAQRLMQALGAYGFLGYERGRAEFLSHIPVALSRLRQVAEGCSGLNPLEGVLASLSDRAGAGPVSGGG